MTPIVKTVRELAVLWQLSFDLDERIIESTDPAEKARLGRQYDVLADVICMIEGGITEMAPETKIEKQLIKKIKAQWEPRADAREAEAVGRAMMDIARTAQFEPELIESF